jgi:hypothetical protein
MTKLARFWHRPKTPLQWCAMLFSKLSKTGHFAKKSQDDA